MAPDIKSDLKKVIVDEIKSGSKISTLKKKYAVYASFIYSALYEQNITYSDLLYQRKKKVNDQNFSHALKLKEKLMRMPETDEVKNILINGARPGIYIDMLHRHCGTGIYKKYDNSQLKILGNSKEELISELIKIALLLQRSPLLSDVKVNSIYDYRDYTKFFGSYKKAVKEANIKSLIRTRRKNNLRIQKQADMICYLLEKSLELGRVPSKKDFGKGSRYIYTDYYRVFGSYKAALKTAQPELSLLRHLP